MMSTQNYTIHKLTDYSRLDEIHRLTHDTLVEAGDITPRPDGKINLYPHLDRSGQTTILVAEQSGMIIGTISMSLDGPDGLHTDSLFNDETDRIRREVPHGLAASWRIATSRQYRSNRGLVLDLIKHTFLARFELHAQVCLFVFNERHVTIYQRLLDAEIVAQRPASLDGEIFVNTALMRINLNESAENFKRRTGIEV
jgi:hypothetical protein